MRFTSGRLRGISPAVRLIQACFHTRSLSLYAKLGYDVREHLACMQGDALGISVDGHVVRPATEEDIAACNRLCAQVHGHDRSGSCGTRSHRVLQPLVERERRITGYATIIGFFGHAVGETQRLKRLSAPPKNSPDQVPSSHAQRRAVSVVPERFANYSANDFDEQRLLQRTAGAFLPSILYSLVCRMLQESPNRYGMALNVS